MRCVLKAIFCSAFLLSAALCSASAQTEEDSSAAQAEGGSSAPQPPAASENTLIIGKDVLTHSDRTSLSKLVLRWADWKMRHDEDRAYPCGEMQEGSVWYFMKDSDSRKQSCKIPAGKYLLFPVVAAHQDVGEESYYIEAGDGDEPGADKKLNCPEAIDTAAEWISHMGIPGSSEYQKYKDVYEDQFMQFEIDDKELTNLYPFHVSFNKCLKPPHKGDEPYALDGYWVLVPPLAKGHHIIYTKYNDRQADCDGMRDQIYQIDIQY